MPRIVKSYRLHPAVVTAMRDVLARWRFHRFEGTLSASQFVELAVREKVDHLDRSSGRPRRSWPPLGDECLGSGEISVESFPTRV